MLVNRNIKQQQQAPLPSISSTIMSSNVQYGKRIELQSSNLLFLLLLDASYTMYILTEDFQSDMKQPIIFINLIDDMTSTNYMRLISQIPIRENLSNDVLGTFKAYGTNIKHVRQ